MIEPLSSDAQPDHVDEDGEVVNEPETEQLSPPKDVPAAADSTTPADAMIAQAYVQKLVLFLLVVGLVFFLSRRRRSACDKLDEKSMA
ncbi:hypothetical protein A1O1_01608 [Capronia coronata CBS 617.96]|uniref:Uncharacterized protein n=1 Tax=Capronia coronata CBS 617.96 TaxID=1182541 RepID=W9YUA4_9EURO|nr:uncharacterized protein A1O1_01608 [Capronia coronata CBS 617.96]EXJ96482.1 hypothetical protein A1O1_01608 [Capronia coronata CBS 617.96]